VTPATSRVFTATVVAVLSPARRDGIVDILASLAPAGVRPVVIVLGDDAEPDRREEGSAIVIDGLLPKYLDNAVASLRLSSLPTLAWWRADDTAMLEPLAALVDRVVLDVDDPARVWPLVPALTKVASVSDLRWTALTRWRELLAQFFDIPDVCGSAESFDRVEIHGRDPHMARLLGGWLRSRLPAAERMHVEVDGKGEASIESVALSGTAGLLSVRLLPHSSCLETSARTGSGHSSLRVVAVGDQRPQALLAEELRVRSRDLAFEDAVRAAEHL
jgi:glucose-6-phosphate dehydrogenase assembly protein OpcA